MISVFIEAQPKQTLMLISCLLVHLILSLLNNLYTCTLLNGQEFSCSLALSVIRIFLLNIYNLVSKLELTLCTILVLNP